MHWRSSCCLGTGAIHQGRVREPEHPGSMPKGLDGAIGPVTPGIEQGQDPARDQESWNFTLGPAGQGLAATTKVFTVGCTLLGTFHLRSKQVLTL